MPNQDKKYAISLFQKKTLLLNMCAMTEGWLDYTKQHENQKQHSFLFQQVHALEPTIYHKSLRLGSIYHKVQDCPSRRPPIKNWCIILRFVKNFINLSYIPIQKLLTWSL